jgi:hypothetical protein
MVYGFITYVSLLMLIISVIKTDIPKTRTLSLTRAVYMIPGVITAALLMSVGPTIVLQDVSTMNNITGSTPSDSFFENVTTTTSFELQNEVWVPVHFMIFIILLLFVILQTLQLFTATSESRRA